MHSGTQRAKVRVLCVVTATCCDQFYSVLIQRLPHVLRHLLEAYLVGALPSWETFVSALVIQTIPVVMGVRRGPMGGICPPDFVYFTEMKYF